MKTWNQKMRAGMRAKGLKHRDLAIRFGVTESAIGHWLSGRREPNISQVQEIAKMLDIDMSELLSENPVFDGEDEIKAAHFIKQMTPAQKKLALRILESLVTEEE